jgi:hypothetical protein
MGTGAGTSPAGSSVAGVGVIDSAPQPGVVPLPDQFTGLSQTGRFIDQQTGDYIFTTDGRVVGMQTVPQLVLIALQDVDLSRIQQKGPNFSQFLASVVQDALGDLIAQRLVLLLGVTVLEPNPDAGVALVSWKDLTTGEVVPTKIY